MLLLAVLARVVPGDPVRALLGARATPERSQEVREQMGLDEPVTTQVYDFFSNALQGDLGVDFTNQIPVTSLIGAALPHTIILAVTSLVMAIMLGVPLGVYAAIRPGTWTDRLAGAFSISLISLPSYVVGILLLLVFAVQLNWLPATGTGDLSQPGTYLRHLILPAAALGVGWVGYIARLVRASMLEVLNATYIRAARAFGLRERVIFYKYALKNAVIPTVAVLGVGLGGLLGGAVFVEVIFARPGLGTLIFNAINQGNFPILRGGILVVALLFIAANLVADLAYRLLDPRIRVEEARTY